MPICIRNQMYFLLIKEMCLSYDYKDCLDFVFYFHNFFDLYKYILIDGKDEKDTLEKLFSSSCNDWEIGSTSKKDSCKIFLFLLFCFIKNR